MKKLSNDYFLLMYYYSKYGIKNLPLNNVNELIKGLLKTTEGTFKKNISSFLSMINSIEAEAKNKNQLDVFNEYKNKTQEEVLLDVLIIIETNSKDLSEYRNNLSEKVKKERKSKEDIELIEIFRKLGRNPSKMKRVEHTQIENKNE